MREDLLALAHIQGFFQGVSPPIKSVVLLGIDRSIDSVSHAEMTCPKLWTKKFFLVQFFCANPMICQDSSRPCGIQVRQCMVLPVFAANKCPPIFFIEKGTFAVPERRAGHADSI